MLFLFWLQVLLFLWRINRERKLQIGRRSQGQSLLNIVCSSSYETWFWIEDLLLNKQLIWNISIFNIEVTLIYQRKSSFNKETIWNFHDGKMKSDFAYLIILERKILPSCLWSLPCYLMFQRNCVITLKFREILLFLTRILIFDFIALVGFENSYKSNSSFSFCLWSSYSSHWRNFFDFVSEH